MSLSPAEPLLSFEQQLSAIAAASEVAFIEAADEPALRLANARLVGPEGSLTLLLKRLPQLPAAERRPWGQRANELKQRITVDFAAACQALVSARRQSELQAPPLDVTLPGRSVRCGSLHPISQMRRDLVELLGSFGFEVADGPEIDLYEYNFDKLGFPPDHPATDMQDSFFVRQGTPGERSVLLRTHTSTVQVREMLRRSPPLAIIAPGAVYRRDDDPTHSPMFFQLEGLLVDEAVDLSQLKGLLSLLLRRLFGEQVKVRWRPSYFPFVEPGLEVDIERHGKWLEVLGCGMVHPVVFEHVGYDPEHVRGFAFGMGIDRLAMLRYGIDDIRLLYENDVRFLSQF